MPIHQIRIPITGQPEDAVILSYALYCATKLQASLLGIHTRTSDQAIPSHKPIGKSDVLPPFQQLQQDCRNRGIVCETLIKDVSWNAALQHSEADMLTALPCGRQFLLPDPDLEKMVYSSDQPILLCPDTYIDIESFALAYDGSNSAKKALDFGAWLSEKAAWPMTVLMVVEDQNQGIQWMDDLEAHLDTLAINSTTVILSGAVEAALYRFLQEGSVELLIMGAGTRSGNDDAHIGPNTAAMIARSRFPLLIVP